MKLFCMVDGCPNFTIVEMKLAPGAAFTCRDHNPPGPQDAHFQYTQFDPEIKRTGKKHIAEPEPSTE